MEREQVGRLLGFSPAAGVGGTNRLRLPWRFIQAQATVAASRYAFSRKAAVTQRRKDGTGKEETWLQNRSQTGVLPTTAT